MRHIASRCSLALSLVLLAGALATSAFAADVAGSTTGIFTNPTLESAGVTTGVGTNDFTWGVAAAGSTVSELTFTGANPFSANFDTPFSLGTLGYTNGTVLLNTGATAVDLQVTAVFTTPTGITKDFTFNLQLTNTPNIGTPQQNADIVSFPNNAPPPQSFTADGNVYTLQLTGFGQPGPNGFVDVNGFHVLEGGTDSADLLAKVTVAPVVPEPMSLALLLPGLAPLGLVLRRRSR